MVCVIVAMVVAVISITLNGVVLAVNHGWISCS